MIEHDEDCITRCEADPRDSCRHLHACEVCERLEYLRSQIKAERISYSEIAELQGMADLIDRSDVELLEWAGVPEFPEDESNG